MITNIFKKIEESMMAAAFAEAGEWESARNMLSVNKNAHKKILLGTDEPEISPRIINHAFNLCKRLGSPLEIFHLISPLSLNQSAKEFVDAGMKNLAELKDSLGKMGIIYQYALRETDFEEELAAYVGKRRDILFLVMPISHQKQETKLNEITRRINCQVVFVEA